MRIRSLTLVAVGALATSCPADFSGRGGSPARERVAAAPLVAPAPAAPARDSQATKPVAAAALDDDDAAPASTWGVHEAASARPKTRAPSAKPSDKPDALDPQLPDEATDDGDPVTSGDPSAADSSSADILDGVIAISANVLTQSGPRIASVAKETWVRDKPSKRARRIGYLRAGATVERSEKSVGNEGCKGGWYSIKPAGFVCAERTATLDLDDPIVRASSVRPRMDGMPYTYAIARTPGPLFYGRVPTRAEQSHEEPDLGYQLRSAAMLAKDPAYVAPDATPLPTWLTGTEGQATPWIPGLSDEPPRGHELTFGQAKPRAGFALLNTFDVDGRAFGLTTELALIPLDRTRVIKGSTFHGIALQGDVSLPVAFVMKHRAVRFNEASTGQMSPGDVLGFREAVPLTGKEKAGGAWLEARDGTWVRGEDVRKVELPHRMPAWAASGRRWIDVSILNQTLVAYAGERPMYVTLVSTGADGLGDPKKTHSTIQGVFLIHTKHVTVTMDNDDEKDQFDLRDVPFVQYFKEGFALHTAYWHDDFGTPRSHGCVNLAPIDAAWLFGFTTPNVPDGWHAALSLHKGTLVYTHP